MAMNEDLILVSLAITDIYIPLGKLCWVSQNQFDAQYEL